MDVPQIKVSHSYHLTCKGFIGRHLRPITFSDKNKQMNIAGETVEVPPLDDGIREEWEPIFGARLTATIRELL